jgi:hypothetical protein
MKRLINVLKIVGVWLGFAVALLLVFMLDKCRIVWTP